MRKVFLPRTFSELWQILEEAPEASLYAGGTDLLVKMRSGLIQPRQLICLERMGDLRMVEDRGEEISIGPCMTFTELLQNQLTRNCFPVLIKGLEVLGSPPIRNMGTIGGNIITASPAGDTLPALYVLGAEIELRSKDSSRRLLLKDFIKGPGQTLLNPGEVLTAIFIKKRTSWNFHHYEKVGQRKALAISIVTLAAVINLSKDGTVKEARLAWGSVAPTVVCSAEVESMLTGNRLSHQVLKEAAQLVRKIIKPIDDIRASSNYRRQVAGNILLRLMI